jgi:hypothetical protein
MRFLCHITRISEIRSAYELLVDKRGLKRALDLMGRFFFNSNSGGGVQLGPLGTSVINWPIVPALSDYDDGEFCGMTIGRETEVLGENLLQCQFVHHKFHMT